MIDAQISSVDRSWSFGVSPVDTARFGEDRGRSPAVFRMIPKRRNMEQGLRRFDPRPDEFNLQQPRYASAMLTRQIRAPEPLVEIPSFD
ncbi:MAG: hypothetical protein LCH74_05590 [Proteobacteria bacterium]|nr:hypothetical protein [Pseudomonadota bacterium]